MSIVSQFNDQMINFCNELEKIYNNNNILSSNKYKLSILKKSNPKKIIEIFISNVYNYKDEIINKNDNFFSELNINDDSNNNKIFNIIKNNWNDYSINTKDNIWLYMNVFIKLSDNYLESINNNKYL